MSDWTGDECAPEVRWFLGCPGLQHHPKKIKLEYMANVILQTGFWQKGKPSKETVEGSKVFFMFPTFGPIGPVKPVLPCKTRVQTLKQNLKQTLKQNFDLLYQTMLKLQSNQNWMILFYIYRWFFYLTQFLYHTFSPGSPRGPWIPCIPIPSSPCREWMSIRPQSLTVIYFSYTF